MKEIDNYLNNKSKYVIEFYYFSVSIKELKENE